MKHYVIRYLIMARDGGIRYTGAMDVSYDQPLDRAATNGIAADIVSAHPDVIAQFGILTPAEIAVTSVVEA